MSDWTSELDGRVGAWVAPVPGSSPTGSDIRYDPVYEALAREVGKLDAPQATPVDWKLVQRDATAILSEKSKDLLVASWLGAALHEQNGLDGLATGLWALGSTVDVFWDGLFPPLKRIKGRTSALTWLVERTVVRIEGHQGALDHDTVERLTTAAKRLQRILPERFGEHAPGTRPLIDAIERLRLSLPPRAEVAAPPVVAAAPVAAPASTSAASPVMVPAAETPPTAAAPTVSTVDSAPPAASGPTHADVLEERVRSLLVPVPGASPTGIDGRYDPEHEALRREMEKLDAPAGGSIAWADVERRGTAFLTATSKDMLIASYVAWAKFELQGLDGLATGLSLLGGLAGGMWEGLHPTRVRARSNALTWLLNRVEQTLLAETPPRGSNDRAVLERLTLAARTFAAVVRDKFADEAPGLRPLLEGIERLKMSLPAVVAPVAAPPPPPPPPPTPAPVAAPAAATATAPAAAGVALPAAPAATLAAGADVTPFLQQVGNSLTQAATTLRTANASDANAYRMRRIGLYLAVQTAPPAAAPPKTQVPAPAAALRQQLTVLQNNGKWAALLDEAESALARNRFWLDLHRWVSIALEGLGHTAARESVLIETAHLVRRLPTLMELQFGDGSAFASPDTIAWLGSIAGAPGGASSGGSAAGAGADDPLDAVIRDARTLAAGGKRDDALRALQAEIKTAPDERARFRLRLASARICGSGGAVPVACGLFDGLVRDIDSMRLDAWDPGLAAETLRAYHEILRDAAKGGGARVADEAADVYRRLCRIDPLAAMGA